MRKYILSVILLSFIGLSFGQSTLEDKLNEVYSAQRVGDILEDIQKKKYFHNILFNSFEIITLTEKEMKATIYPVIHTLNFVNKTTKDKTSKNIAEVILQLESGTFNVLLADIQRKMDKTIFYRLGNTNKVLAVYSYSYLTKLQIK